MIMKILKNLPNRLHLIQEELEEEEEEGAVKQDNSKREEEEVSVYMYVLYNTTILYLFYLLIYSFLYFSSLSLRCW